MILPVKITIFSNKVLPTIVWDVNNLNSPDSAIPIILSQWHRQIYCKTAFKKNNSIAPYSTSLCWIWSEFPYEQKYPKYAQEIKTENNFWSLFFILFKSFILIDEDVVCCQNFATCPWFVNYPAKTKTKYNQICSIGRHILYVSQSKLECTQLHFNYTRSYTQDDKQYNISIIQAYCPQYPCSFLRVWGQVLLVQSLLL